MTIGNQVLSRKSGLRVSQLALGTGNFGTGWGYGSDFAEAKQIFDHYAEAGGFFIDTADGYQVGQSEEFVGQLIAKDRDHFVLSSKYTMGAENDGSISKSGNSRKNMVRSVDASLKRLNTDHIDLYWAHFTDETTPMEEIMRGFEDLVQTGKIHYAGLSNFPAWRVARADLLGELRGWSPLVAIQTEYNLVERSAERDLIPMADALGLGIMTWSPLAGGLLTGKYRNNEQGRLQGLGGVLVRSEQTNRETAILDAIIGIATEAETTPANVAIAWLLDQSRSLSTGMVPILGPRTLAQLDATLGALDIHLTSDQVNRLTAASAFVRGTPHDQIQSLGAKARGGDKIIRPAGLAPAA